MKFKETEKDVQFSIMEYLKMQKIFHYRNNTGASPFESNGKRYFVRFGAVGAPDIVAVINGQYVGIEVKGTDGKQSNDQKMFQYGLEMAGAKYILARSLDELIDQLPEQKDEIR